MQQKLITSTSLLPLGYPPRQRLLKVPSGQYLGRQVAIVRTGSSTIKLLYADPPHNVWSTPLIITSVASGSDCDAMIDESGNVYVAFAENVSSHLQFVKLSLSGGVYSVGTPVTINNTALAASPSLGLDSNGTMWVSWTYYVGPNRYIYVKKSTDEGATWGSGPSDVGVVLTPATTSTSSRLVVGATEISVFYTYAGTKLSIRSIPLVGGSWSTEIDLATGSGFDEQFDAAVSPLGALGVVFDNGQLRFREHDGDSWGTVIVLDSNGGDGPQLTYTDAVPFVIYLSEYASGQIRQKYTLRSGSSFISGTLFDRKSDIFASVLLYDSVSSTYASLSAEAASDAVADLFHPSSSVIFEQSDDVLYLGMDEVFRYLRIKLSTAGAGGTVTYSFWDGSHWSAFTPVGGNYGFDSADKQLVLFDDYNSVPADWQKKLVNGVSRFWVRIEVDSVFTTGPVGSQLTAIGDTQAISVRR